MAEIYPEVPDLRKASDLEDSTNWVILQGSIRSS